MNKRTYYHIYSNGADARNLISCTRDAEVAFNRIAVCAAEFPEVEVVAANVLDTHVHILTYGTLSDSAGFKERYVYLTRHYIYHRKGPDKDDRFHMDIYEAEDDAYLKNLGAYVVIQPTKDRKKVMYYDYLYGTGSLYFRNSNVVPVWLVNEDGSVSESTRFGDIPRRDQIRILGTRIGIVPDSWQVCKDIVLPTNYINIARFENIYKTHNAFRAFSSSGGKADQEISDKMTGIRGVDLEESEAREICKNIMFKKFNVGDLRKLDGKQRMEIAWELRKSYKCGISQISRRVHLPEAELSKYLL